MKKSHLTLEQRYAIQAYLEAGYSISSLSSVIGKNKSVISRELSRNSNPKGKYKAAYANEVATLRKERFHQPRKMNQEMEKRIRSHIINDQWSPEQIKGYYHSIGIDMVSHERIYQMIRTDDSLIKNTRHKLKHRKRPINGKHQNIKNKRSIEDRPSIVDEKTRIGDWEIDTIIGKGNKGAIVTIVERKTGFLMMRKLPKGKNAHELKNTVIDMLLPYKNTVMTITADNGSEFACHEQIAQKLNANFYFAHPYSSWERGINEYTNKLIRQYIPKKQSFEKYSPQEIMEIQHKLNARPRKLLKFMNPKQLFYANIA